MQERVLQVAQLLLWSEPIVTEMYVISDDQYFYYSNLIICSSLFFYIIKVNVNGIFLIIFNFHISLMTSAFSNGLPITYD